MIELKSQIAYQFNGKFTYFILYDYSSGSSRRSNGRYTVLVQNVDDPITIGRELPLKNCKKLIQHFEFEGKDIEYFGDREAIYKVLDKVLNKRFRERLRLQNTKKAQ